MAKFYSRIENKELVRELFKKAFSVQLDKKSEGYDHWWSDIKVDFAELELSSLSRRKIVRVTVNGFIKVESSGQCCAQHFDVSSEKCELLGIDFGKLDWNFSESSVPEKYINCRKWIAKNPFQQLPLAPALAEAEIFCKRSLGDTVYSVCTPFS